MSTTAICFAARFAWLCSRWKKFEKKQFISFSKTPIILPIISHLSFFSSPMHFLRSSKRPYTSGRLLLNQLFRSISSYLLSSSYVFVSAFSLLSPALTPPMSPTVVAFSEPFILRAELILFFELFDVISALNSSLQCDAAAVGSDMKGRVAILLCRSKDNVYLMDGGRACSRLSLRDEGTRFTVPLADKS